MWHKAEWMGHPMRLELTRVGLLVKLANRYTTKGASLSIYIYTTVVQKVLCLTLKVSASHSCQTGSYLTTITNF